MGATITGNIVSGNFVGTQAGGSGILANTAGAFAITNGASVKAGGTFTGGVNNFGTLDLAGNAVSIVGAFAGTGTVTNSAAGGTSTLTLNGTGTFGGVIQNGATASVALTIAGGTVTLSAASTYTGPTTIFAGALRLAAVPDYSFETPAAPFTSPPATAPLYWYNPTGASWTFSAQNGSNGSGIAANGSAFNNATAPDGTQVAFLQGTGSFSESVSFASAGTDAITFQSAFRNANSGVNNFEVLVDGAVVGTFTPSTSSSYLSYSTSSFAVTAGSHTVEFLGLDTGGGDRTSFVDNISVTGTAPLSANILPSATAVTVGVAATFNLNGINTTIGSLTGLAASSVTLGGATLTFGNAANTAFAGVISGTGGLVKQGSGAFTLAGANTYTGPTTISGGTVSVSSDGNLGADPSSATVGNLVLSNGGTLQFTNAAGLTLNANRGITLGAGGGVIDTAGATVNYAGAIVGGAGLTTEGDDLVLFGGSSTPGPVTINSGRLVFVGQGSIGSGADH